MPLRAKRSAVQHLLWATNHIKNLYLGGTQVFQIRSQDSTASFLVHSLCVALHLPRTPTPSRAPWAALAPTAPPAGAQPRLRPQPPTHILCAPPTRPKTVPRFSPP